MEANVRDSCCIATPLFRFDGLMKAFAPPPARLEAAREFVDDDDLPVFHHIILVPLEKGFRAHRSLQMVHVLDARIGVDIPDAERLLRFFDALIIREDYLLVLFFHGVIYIMQKGTRDPREALVKGFRVGDGRGDDEWRSRFIKEDGV